jgi:hypothetical protein
VCAARGEDYSAEEAEESEFKQVSVGKTIEKVIN